MTFCFGGGSLALFILVLVVIVGKADAECVPDETDCSSPKLAGQPCYGGSIFQPCSCKDGKHARVIEGNTTTGPGGKHTFYKYECCNATDIGSDPDTPGDVCGDYRPEAQCSKPSTITRHKPKADGVLVAEQEGFPTSHACDSPGFQLEGGRTWGEVNCWSGTMREACICRDPNKVAHETGETFLYKDQGRTYFEYVCCEDGFGGEGERCGAYSPYYAIIAPFIWLFFFISGCFCCYKCAKNHLEAEDDVDNKSRVAVATTPAPGSTPVVPGQPQYAQMPQR
mmetsp:Transcript_12757/g.25991  ORF Transcript_12757/g.25991 Transcript_12757/m.25991 type:complete len:282 (+) Transcript_12757:118-963(+)|eukprot:CAMPEP_0118631938 /NCGR_PEP_ID=MMETSP0785-20121206/174_1 /TAXON_ID=91992 /ORGANISM="Bolidomonas pacifica, Strain CCMP 1866" /LENGTH=281 /DNA_ID=CAMNT_0006522667 /DNA_START=71 /DNA_END=916 /DNA_ORIENTATION=+